MTRKITKDYDRALLPKKEGLFCKITQCPYMNVEKYSYETTDDFLDYEFDSIGPRGTIRKIVRYSLRFSSNNQPFYNLGFGDLDEEKQQINDSINSGNGDMEKILATVANTVVDFTGKYPEMPVYVEGSTPSRIRL